MRSEFSFLSDLKNHFNLSRIGDDCAVFPKDEKTDYVISSDMLVEDIDFRLEWTTPNFIGHKALSVSISDIAAMGGTPVYSMLSIGIPEKLWNSDFLDKFYEGYFEYAKRVVYESPHQQALSVELIGGDISRTNDLLTVDSTVLGTVTKGRAVMRSGAKPGDHIFVTGTLGGAAYGLQLLEKGFRYGTGDDAKNVFGQESIEGRSILDQLRPFAQTVNRYQQEASSMIDISDGLSSDLKHICDASGVGARIYVEKIPAFVDGPINGLTIEQILEMVLHGGEDFELLFTAAPEVSTELADFPYKPIGEITDFEGIIELVSNGFTSHLKTKGYRHF